jgi:hypothetical protein
MEIKYLKQLKDNPNLKSWTSIRGWELSKIEALETKYNKGRKFPLAFREYLFLAGDFGGTGVVNEDWDDLHADCQEDLNYFGYKVQRPYFVFDNYDSQYKIFYLDEELEDPKIFILDPYGKNRGEFDLVRPAFINTFSKLINEAIYRIKNDIPF